MKSTIMALALALSAAAPLAAARAQDQPPPRIVVTGEGEAAVAPDMAMLSLGVMREAKTARGGNGQSHGASSPAFGRGVDGRVRGPCGP